MPQKHTFRASKGDGGFTHARRPDRKGDSGFIATKQCTRYSTNAPDSTASHWQLSSALSAQVVQCPRGTNAIAKRRPRPIIPHAIPIQPDPTPTQNPQNSNDQTSNRQQEPGHTPDAEPDTPHDGRGTQPLKNTTNTSHNELLHQDPLQPPLEPRISHVIRLSEVSTKSENVAIPTI